jgi:hypothetical protein
MNAHANFVTALASSIALLAIIPGAHADEFGFSTYGLGGAAFGAGVTPPPGTYITSVSGYYQGKIHAPITFGNVTLEAGAKVKFFQQGLNGLYVPDRKVFGGNIGIGVTIPVGHNDLSATVTGPLQNSFHDETAGWGLGDITTRLQLGWQDGDFAHLTYVQVVAPSGKYAVGFQPIIGLSRPGIDTGWAFTWTEKTSKLQFNGAVGVTFNFENTTTDYQSGTDFHFEWAVGREISPGLVVGVVGYDYRQLTGDSGSGARLGPLEGTVDAIGGGVSYTTLIGKTPLILSARHYQEFNVENRWDGSMTILSGTMKF